MINFNEFAAVVKSEFNFLQSEFSYELQVPEAIPFMYYVAYVKKNFMMRIGLAYRHDYVEIYFFRDIHKYTPSTQDFDHSISLGMIIMNKKENLDLVNFDYESYMPNKIGLNESLQELAGLVKTHCRDILKKKNW